jgi:hypothetical protein
VARLRPLVVLLVVGVLAVGCASVPRVPHGDDRANGPAATGTDGDEGASVVDVRVDTGGTTHLIVTDGPRPRELAALPATDGQVVHTAVRPSRRSDPLTVLVLVRRDDPDDVARYELRYAVDTGEERLEDLPSHLQVDVGTAIVLDVPPLPVWAPDGSAVAWVEWNPLGTRLRALGWDVEDDRTRPASEAVAYRLDEVPPGVQLDGWEVGDGGEVVLTGRRDGERWRIAVEHDEQRLALAVVGSR